RRRLGVVHDRLVPALWRPDPAWPMSTTGEMEWLNRDDILAPSLAFDSEAAFVVSNPRHEAGRLLVRAADGGEELAAMELSSGDALAYLSVATAALRRGAELVFESTAGTRLLASLPAWPAAPAPIQPRLRLVFSPCDLATRADVSPEVSAMSAAFNAEVWAHFARHPFQLGIVQPLPPVSDSPALDRSIAENVLAALHNDAFLAWAGQEDETYGEIVKTAVVNVWTGSIVFEGYFPMPSGSDPGAVVTAMCRRCEVVLYREFPAFLARLESLSPQGGRLTTGPGMVLPIGTTLVVHRPSPEGTPARAAMLKVRHSYPGGLEAWEVERTDPEPLRVGDLVATEWTPPDAIAAALAR
ncbi:hypothetical protein HS125_07740, partial [bacterium]|nr:hypothetical protein [bacterium]